MVNHKSALLDSTFAALADPTRRAILGRLTDGALPLTALAEPFRMSLPGVLKHVRVLEGAGLVLRHRRGRAVHCELRAQPMRDAVQWLNGYQRFWLPRLDALERFLQQNETPGSPPCPTPPPPTLPASGSSAATRLPRKPSSARGRSRRR